MAAATFFGHEECGCCLFFGTSHGGKATGRRPLVGNQAHTGTDPIVRF